MKEELSKKYTFKSGSDCEILLPLYREYGVDMFKMLDAEFALIIYDGEEKKYIAARDPIGIRPLYYGYDRKRCYRVRERGEEPRRTVRTCYALPARTLLQRRRVCPATAT